MYQGSSPSTSEPDGVVYCAAAGKLSRPAKPTETRVTRRHQGWFIAVSFRVIGRATVWLEIKVSSHSVGVPIKEHEADGAGDDAQIETDRPVAQVLEVVLDPGAHLLDRVGLAAVSVHLGPAGDAGLDLVRDRVRPRADDAHAALQDVEELRQLVERVAAQEGAERRDPRVVARRLAD